MFLLCRYIVICIRADLGAYVSICCTLATWKHQSGSCQTATSSPWSSALWDDECWYSRLELTHLFSWSHVPDGPGMGGFTTTCFLRLPRQTDFSASLCPCWVLALQCLLILSLFSLTSPLPHGQEYRCHKAQLWSSCCLESKEACGGHDVNPDALMTLKTVCGWSTSSHIWANFLAQCKMSFLPFSAWHNMAFTPSGQCLPVGRGWDASSLWQGHGTREEPARQLFLTWGCPGGPICPLQSRQDEKGTCKAALPLEVVPGARYVPFFLLSYCCWAFY